MPHTPGPWKCRPIDVRTINSYRGFEISGYETTHSVRNVLETEVEANARLIAAAPELLAAAQAALNDRMYTDWPGVADLLIAAITKAGGEL